MASHAGRLLVAGPALVDGNFRRTVVLLVDDDDEGAVGVVLNRATTAPLDGPLEPYARAATAPACLFAGGPVEPTAVIALGRTVPESTGDADFPLAGVRLVGLDDADALAGIRQLRIFAGYAGWSNGQLDDELAQGAWFVVDAEPDDVFTTQPAALWATVLRRQQGRLRLLSTFPDNPSHN